MWKGISANNSAKLPADKYYQIARHVLSYHGTRFPDPKDMIVALLSNYTLGLVCKAAVDSWNEIDGMKTVPGASQRHSEIFHSLRRFYGSKFY